MDTFKAIYGRRAIRDFERGKPIPRDTVRTILDTARYALPTPEGLLPWRFLMVKSQDSKDLMADCAKEIAMVMFGASYEIFAEGHLWYLPRETQMRVAEDTTTGVLWEYPRDASVVFVPVMSTGGWTDSIMPFTDDIEIISQFTGFAAQNMWLAGYTLGIGAGFNAVPFMDIRRREVLGEHFGVPDSWQTGGGFCFGYPAVPRYFGPARPPLEGVVFSQYWGNNYVRKAFGKGKFEVGLPPETDLINVIKSLNPVKTFRGGRVPDWMVEKVLDAALWGPVPENFKQWRYLVVKDQPSKDFIASLVAEKCHCPWSYNYPELQMSRAYRIPEEDQLDWVEERYNEKPGAWIPKADTLIIVFSSFTNWRDQPYPTLGANPNPNRNVATGCCTQNMMLAASALGLGFNYDVYSVADRRTRSMLVEHFGVPGVSWLPQGVLGIGEAGEKVKLPEPPPLENLVFEEYWGNPVKEGAF